MTAAGNVQPPAALLFDFNGTLSDDEQVLYEIYAAIVAGEGVSLTRDAYFGGLVGESDAVVFRTCLGDRADIEALTARRIDAYIEAVSDGSTVSAAAREAVAEACSRMPVGLVTSAFRREVTPLLQASGIERMFGACVFAEDVTATKPSPEPYLLACSRLGIRPAAALAIEDTGAGLAAAKSAGLRCAIFSTAAEPPPGADAYLAALDAEAVDLLLRPA